MHRTLHFLLHMVSGLLVAAVVAGLFGILVRHLWNALMPFLFHLPPVNFLQAAGLVLLARLLFGNVGGHHRHGKGKWRKWQSHCKDWDMRGGRHGWKQYGRYWKEEGKTHFEAWQDRQAD